MAACGLAWPRRAINSLVVAPVRAAKVLAVCLKSWNRNPVRPAALVLGSQTR